MPAPDKNQFIGREDTMAALGVNHRQLGYVGLTFDPLPVRYALSQQRNGILILDTDYAYAPDGDWRTWVAGPVAEHNPHVTLKYGLMSNANSIKNEINSIIGDPRGKKIEVVDVTVFKSPYHDLPYGCLVAVLGGDYLHRLNAALGVIPHVDSFAVYKPHLTLAYLKSYNLAEYAGVNEAYDWLVGTHLTVTGVDYGKAS